MAIELKGQVEADLGRNLALSSLMRGATLTELADEAMTIWDDSPAQPSPSTSESMPLATAAISGEPKDGEQDGGTFANDPRASPILRPEIALVCSPARRVRSRVQHVGWRQGPRCARRRGPSGEPPAARRSARLVSDHFCRSRRPSRPAGPSIPLRAARSRGCLGPNRRRNPGDHGGSGRQAFRPRESGRSSGPTCSHEIPKSIISF